MLSELRARKFDNLFRLLDGDGDGLVGRADFAAVGERLAANFGVDMTAPLGKEVHQRHTALYDELGVPDGEPLTAERFRGLLGDATAPGRGLEDTLHGLARTVVRLCDIDGDAELGPPEFRAFLGSWRLPADDADRAFRHLDIDGSATVSFDELTEALEEFYGSDDPHAPGNWLFGPIEEADVPRALLPYPDAAELAPETAELLAALPRLNLFRMAAHAHTLFRPFITLGKTVYTDLDLPGDLRELVVLQVAQELGSNYVWTQHVSAAQAESTPRAKIVALRDRRLNAPCLTEVEQAALTFTAEVLHRGRAPEATFEKLRRVLTPQQIVELLMVTGWYAMVGRLATALDLDADRSQGDDVRAYAHDR